MMRRGRPLIESSSSRVMECRSAITAFCGQTEAHGVGEQDGPQTSAVPVRGRGFCKHTRDALEVPLKAGGPCAGRPSAHLQHRAAHPCAAESTALCCSKHRATPRDGCRQEQWTCSAAARVCWAGLALANLAAYLLHPSSHRPLDKVHTMTHVP